VSEDGKISCIVTRYVVQQGELQERERVEETSYEVRDGWLYLGNSAASARIEYLRRRAQDELPWGAQFGTPPVRVDGYWGGRNYPNIVVEGSELARVLAAEGEL
jgi:hypothetical protein